MGLELSPELLLSALVGNPCPTGVMGMLVEAARLAPSAIISAPFGTTGILELGQPEWSSTTGTLEQLEMLCLSGWSVSPDQLVGVVMLALLDNMFLTGITS